MENKKLTCYYYGKFAPPTKYHFNVAMMLETRHDIENVKVIIGTESPEIISQEDKYEMWKMFLDSEPTSNISLIKTDGVSSLQYVVDETHATKNKHVFIATDSKTAKSEKFNKLFVRLSNIKFQLIPSQFNDKSLDLLNAIEENKMSNILELLPNGITKEDAIKIKKIISQKEEEPVEEKSTDIKTNFIKEFNDIIFSIFKK